MTDEAERGSPGRGLPVAWILRVVVSALVLGVLLSLLPVGDVWATMRELSPVVWLACLGVFVVGHVVASLKWRLLIDPARELTVLTCLRAHFAGLVANLCLPGAAGGDVARAGLVLRGARDKASIAVGSLADRLIDTVAVFALACAGAASSWSPDTETIVLRIGGVMVLLALGGGAAFLVLRRLPEDGELGRVGKLVRKVDAALAALTRRPGALALSFLLSLAVQSTFVGLNVALASASGIDAPTSAWFFAWCVAKLIAVVPISLGGLGVREASLAALLSPFGALPERVVAVGLLWQSILIAGGLLGALVLMFARTSSPDAASSSKLP